MTLTLDTPTPADLVRVLDWRKTCPESLRTPRDLTPPEQEAFYRDVICNPKAQHRYYAVIEWVDVAQDADAPTLVRDGKPFLQKRVCVALVSLEHISWENGHAEIGLIVDPSRHGQGIGREAVRLVLEVAFNRLGLKTVWGEAYLCGHPMFWQEVVTRYHGSSVIWPRRKFWNGELHDALLFTITADGYRTPQEG